MLKQHGEKKWGFVFALAHEIVFEIMAFLFSNPADAHAISIGKMCCVDTRTLYIISFAV